MVDMQGGAKGKWVSPSKALPLMDGFYVCMTSEGTCIRFYSHRDREFQSSWANAPDVKKWFDTNTDEPQPLS